MTSSLARHSRFLFAFAFGAAVALGTLAMPFAWQIKALIGVNSFFLTYLALTARLAISITAKHLKQQAEADDEGIFFIVLLAIGAVFVSLAAIIWVLGNTETVLWQSLLAFSAVPLGWGTIHTVAAFRYAHLFYASGASGGLTFPGTAEPSIFDFLYLSFGIGMTAQVSDVVVTDQALRKMVLVHAIGAFFYNTVILAFAVNAAFALGG